MQADDSHTHFKGWAKPGPVPPDLSAGLTVAPDETLDAISGHFRLTDSPIGVSPRQLKDLHIEVKAAQKKEAPAPGAPGA